MKQYKENLLSIIQSKRFIFFVGMTVLLAFGFAVFNMSFCTDLLSADHHYGSGQVMLGSGRFAMDLLATIFNFSKSKIFNHSTMALSSLLMLVWAGANYCVLFRRICGSHFTDGTAVFFTCFFVSYPLIIEIWQYTGAAINICFGFLCNSFIYLMLHHVLHVRKHIGCIVGSVVLIMLVCAGYESMVVCYIFGVFALLFLQAIYGTKEEKALKGIILQGLCYAGVLAAGFIAKVLVHKLILIIGNMDTASNAARDIYWLTRPFKETLLTMLASSFEHMVLRGIIYFPITELLGACVALLVLGILFARKHGAAILLPVAGMYFSLVALNILTGDMPNYRSCQVFGFFVAFVLALVVMELESCKLPKVRICALFLCGWVCFQQALYVNYFFTLDHQRSVTELNAVADVGRDIQTEFGTDKPVIVVGSHSIPSEIREAASIPADSLRWKLYQKAFLACKPLSELRFSEGKLSRHLPQSLDISVIAWAIYTGGPDAIPQLFAYQGYSFDFADKETYFDLAAAYVSENNVPKYPTPGYICDMGDLIVVHMG